MFVRIPKVRLTGSLVRVAFRGAASAWRRSLLRTEFLVVSGGPGKTIAARCLSEILARQTSVARAAVGRGSPGSSVKAVLATGFRKHFAVVEAGLFQKGDMADHSSILRPDAAVILGWRGAAPLSLSNREDLAVEQWSLIKRLNPSGLLVLDGDDVRTMTMVDRGRYKVVTFGESERCNFRISKAESAWPKRLCFRITNGFRSAIVTTQLVGTHWASPVAAAIATAVTCGVPLDRAAAAVERIKPLAGRMEPVTLPGGATFLRDDYCVTKPSVEAALDLLKNALAGRRVAVLGDFEDDEMSASERARYLGRRASESCDLAVFLGEGAAAAAQAAVDAGMPQPLALAFESAEDAAVYLESEVTRQDLVLLKGSKLAMPVRAPWPKERAAPKEPAAEGLLLLPAGHAESQPDRREAQ